MYTIKEYNKKVNSSTDPNSNHMDWKVYRDDITDFIIQNFSSNNRVAVIGAGYLNDLDLNRILNVADDITLIDIDIEAVQKGLLIQNIENNKVKTIECDITSLDKSNFFEKLSYLLENRDIAGIKRFLYFEGETKSEIDIEGIFDIVIVMPIYTQLLVSQYLDMLHLLISDEEAEQYLDPFMYFISKIIRKINQNFLELTKKDLTIISDILEYRSDDTDLIDLKEHLEDPAYIDAFCLNYSKKYGEGLGSYGINDISEKIKVKSSKWYVWEIAKDRQLITKAIYGVK